MSEIVRWIMHFGCYEFVYTLVAMILIFAIGVVAIVVSSVAQAAIKQREARRASQETKK